MIICVVCVIWYARCDVVDTHLPRQADRQRVSKRGDFILEIHIYTPLKILFRGKFGL